MHAMCVWAFPTTCVCVCVSMFMQRKISLLGSTGSIGTQTLDIVAERGELYEVGG